MLTFGYKKKYSGFLRAAIALILGLVLLYVGEEYVAYVAASYFLLSALLSLVGGFVKKSREPRLLILVNSGLSLAIAVIMCLFASQLSVLIHALLGVVLIASAVFHLLVLTGLTFIFKKPKWLLIMPVVVLVIGVLLLVRPDFISVVVSVLIGAALVLYSMSEMISSLLMRKVSNRNVFNQFRASAFRGRSGGAADMCYDNVDEQ